jgi:hypothetical protein
MKGTRHHIRKGGATTPDQRESFSTTHQGRDFFGHDDTSSYRCSPRPNAVRTLTTYYLIVYRSPALSQLLKFGEVLSLLFTKKSALSRCSSLFVNEPNSIHNTAKSYTAYTHKYWHSFLVLLHIPQRKNIRCWQKQRPPSVSPKPQNHVVLRVHLLQYYIHFTCLSSLSIFFVGPTNFSFFSVNKNNDATCYSQLHRE